MMKRDLAKAKKLLGSYPVSSFEDHFEYAGQYRLAVKFQDGSTQVFGSLSEVQAWTDAQDLNNPLFEVIARKNFGLETLETQGHYRLYFVKVHVLDIQKALRDAFKAGADSVRRSK